MKIAELLNGSTSSARRHRVKRTDMLSLDLSAQKRTYRSELFMGRIIQEQGVKTDGLSTLSQLITRRAEDIRLNDPKTEVRTNIRVKKADEERSTNNQLSSEFTPLAQSDKRMKQRMLVKRSYYRKIDTLVELRDEMEALETKCRQVIISRRPFHASSLPLENESRQQCEQLREQYSQLSITQDELRHENEKLRLKAMELSKARTRIFILLNEELQDQKEARAKGTLRGFHLSSPSQPPSQTPTNLFGTCTHPKPTLEFTPITVDECRTIVQAAYTDVRAFVDEQRYETSGATVFGWRDKRQVNGETMRFFLEKTFQHVTASEISKRMWNLVSSEQGVNRIYASDVAIQFHLVQRVNDESVLFYRTIEPSGANVVLKALVLASRIQLNERGNFLLLFRSVDPKTRGISKLITARGSDFPTEKKEIWSEVFSWGLYEAVGDSGQHCRNYFGGSVSSLLTQQSLGFWLLHILLIAVRCENEVIGPLFLSE